MLTSLKRLAKRANWGRRRWSTAADRTFHDAVFANQTYDPFSASYPGYVTIRRFAELASPHVRPSELVLDLGCGPGEVTCEMARRLPESRFLGVDHSREAIARAEQLAKGLSLTNIRFEIQDLEGYEPPDRVGLVTMFDAFHHLLDPARFVARIGLSCDRFFLVEPQGNWLGQWQKTFELDWLAEALFVVRDRLEYQLGLAPPQGDLSQSSREEGEPTEHRYSMEDFSQWFAGYGLDICGTVAGLERYGTAPYAKSALRDGIGHGVYNLIVEIEATLRRENLDLAAKHWAIYAERGRTFPHRSLPDLPQRVVRQPLAGAYDTDYEALEGPAEVSAGTIVEATLTLVNRSWRTWSSDGAGDRILVSYHWRDRRGATIVEDGMRSPLPRPLAPGERCRVAVRIQCPTETGRYTLAVDLVHEQVTWFSRAGVPPLLTAMRVAR